MKRDEIKAMTTPAVPMPPSRRWMPCRIKLSIRGLMLLVAVVGGSIGWIGHRARTQRQVVEAVVRCGGQVSSDSLGSWSRRPHKQFPGSSLFWGLYDDYFTRVAGVWFNRTMKPDRGVRLRALSTFTRLGSLYAPGVELTNAEIVAISNLGSLRDLNLEGTGIDAAGVAHLAGLGQLRILNLAGADITDADLAHLSGLSQLATLNLSETGVTDAGMIHLVRLPALKSLTLHSTAVTSKGLRALGGLPSLRWLEIHSESVSNEEIKALRRAFPSLQINTNPFW